MELHLGLKKDIGLEKTVYDALPYAVVRGNWEASFNNPIGPTGLHIALNHIIPAGHQLKILFLRVWTQEAGGARFRIFQVNPTALLQTGAVEAFPVMGNAPAGVVDYPMLEAPGAEVLHGSLEDPVHVTEGSIHFDVLGPTPIPATGARYGVSWWGVQKIPGYE